MQIIWAKAALTPEGWQSDVQIAVVGTSVIATVDANSPPEGIREDPEFEKLACCRGDENLDTFISSCDNRLVSDIWATDRHVVREGCHINRQPDQERYLKPKEKIMERLIS